MGAPPKALFEEAEVPVESGSCVTDMTVLPKGKMLVGHDYRQTQLQGDNDDVLHCIQACCADPKCKAWAVATSTLPTTSTCRKGTPCCWLKTAAGSPQSGTGEIAAGLRAGSPIPTPKH